MLKFCPCELEYKSRVGGIRANEPLRFNVFGEAGSIMLVLTKEGEGHCPVNYGMVKTENGFSVTICITTSGLYFYHFLVDGVRYGANDLLELVEGGVDYLQLVHEAEFRPLCGGVIYQIMPDRFFCAKSTQNADTVSDIYKMPTHLPDKNGKHNTEFFGGNLRGIMQKLDYLLSLGVTYIYLNPIFESDSNHRYDTGDYEKIDSLLGTEADFDELISEAEKRGIGLILDGVFSHTGANSKYFNRYGTYDTVGAYQSQSSPFYDWYEFIDYPDVYKSWWGFENLPEVNEVSPSYIEYMLGENGAVVKWDNKGIAGWRLDVADELPDGFLYKLRERTKSTLIGEVWENAARKYAYGQRRSYFMGQLDGVTNYPVRSAIIDFIMTGDNSLLRRTVRELVNDYPPEAFLSMMNIVGTHDTDRILTALSYDARPKSKDDRATHIQSDIAEAIERVKLASIIQFVLPGVPCVYYGDEAGLNGYEDPFCRKFYPWGRENIELIAHYKRLGQRRKEYASVFAGTSVDISPSNKVFKIKSSDGHT